MSAARHMIALLKSHLEGDDKEFLSVAMQAAAHEARLGHITITQQLRDLIDESKRRSSAVASRPGQLVVLEPRGELASLLSVQTPSIRFSDMALPEALAERLKRVLLEQRQQKRLREHSLSPRRKLLFLGPPGSGKTMTASALSGELHLPLFTIMLEGLITKFMGETRRNCASSSKPSARPRASISSTNSMRSARTAARRTMWAKSAAS
jgi:SpoVK/Ycf46/Vps4 family AAA+-type ATPase